MIFKLLDQYEGICRRAFFGCTTKLNKNIKTNIIEILILIMCIHGKINFSQLGRYGRRCEQGYRQTAARDFDWLGYNMSLAANRFQYGMKRMAIAIDPSYVSKAGKKTDHVGRFWSGCASAVKHGLELLGIAVVDADVKDAMMLRAELTHNASELKARKMNLTDWYLHVLDKYKPELLKITSLMVADAASRSSALTWSAGSAPTPYCSTSMTVPAQASVAGQKQSTAKSISPIPTKVV